MSVARRFLVAPSLVRLMRKERGSARVTEGFFPPQGGRTSYVRVEGNQCQLVLVVSGAAEERTEVPRAHGDALLDVCAGKAAYDRTTVSLGAGHEASVDRYVTPSGVDLVSVVFETPDAARSFAPPAWFGSEVTEDGAYASHAIALQGPPSPGEVPLSNTALDAALDLFDHRFGAGSRFGASRAPSGQEGGLGLALRRLAGGSEASAAPAKPSQETPAPAAPAPEPAVPAPESTAAAPEPKLPVAEDGEAGRGNDARIDDVIESLSQALGASLPQRAEGEAGSDAAAPFERWTTRQRRSQ